MNPRGEMKFLVDTMLGRLARWLRIMGFDARYLPNKPKSEVELESLRENRILLTRNRRISAKRAWKVVFVKSDSIYEQISQLVKQLSLKIDEDCVHTRCSECNIPLVKIEDKATVKNSVPEYVYKHHDDFSICPSCRKVFWEGTHIGLLKKDILKAGVKI
ncbi:MAG: Mut7-C RNAse domain-containing protein [Endomicrobiales bacterium]|nr:Mut7-C RNAse domain-containing protein [Endomicrobiales bacterium]